LLNENYIHSTKYVTVAGVFGLIPLSSNETFISPGTKYPRKGHSFFS